MTGASFSKTGSKTGFLAAVVFLLLLTVQPFYGQNQEFAATLNGTVTDPTGLPITGAKVKLTSAQNGVNRASVTQDGGLFSFTLLPPAIYSLEIDAAGFKDYRQQGITLGAGQTAQQNVRLTVGSTTETIEVTTQAPLLNADNANISSDISAKQVADLPLNLRNVISLAELNSSVGNTAEEQVVGAPGISGSADQDVSFLNFGGTFFDTAEYLLDGSWDTRVDWGGVLYVPSTDDVEEFKIQTNAFTSQYGWSSGNVINVVTKSGTNQFHGDAWMFYRNSAYDARYYFDNGSQPAFHRDQFGATIGGPIIKNKLYFFGYYEGLRQATPATFLGSMPTTAERTGNFSALLGPHTGTDYLGRPIYTGEIYNPFSTRQVTCGGVDSATGDKVSNCPAGATTEYIRDPISGNVASGAGVTNIIPAASMDAIAKSIASGQYWLGAFLASGYTRKAAADSPAGVAAHSNKSDAKISNSWDAKAAAAYLDRRQSWWMEWPRAQRDHETFCVSCHTAVPYALSRSALRTPLDEQAPSPNEQRLLNNVTKRVRLWKEVEPFYKDADRGPYKSVESRGTESVLNALILSSRDAQSSQLSDDTRTAFQNMWAEQQIDGKQKGAWLWLRFNNEPWEANDSDYFGATLAAVAVGIAPGNYRATPEVKTNLKLLREYLNREFDKQTTINRVLLLWADAKLPRLLEPDRQKAIIGELLEKQQADGGWSLSSLSGGWKRADGTTQETTSDGYATGLITFALQQAGLPPENAKLARGLAWLTANQDKSAGSWPAYSLNKNKEHHISPETALFMNDAATSYAVLSLTAANRR